MPHDKVPHFEGPQPRFSRRDFAKFTPAGDIDTVVAGKDPPKRTVERLAATDNAFGKLPSLAILSPHEADIVVPIDNKGYDSELQPAG